MTQTPDDSRLLLDSLALPVLELDGTARILYGNAAASALTGVAHAALVGQLVNDVVPEWQGLGMNPAVQACLRTGTPQHTQIWWRERLLRIEISATPQGVLLVGYDLTESHHTQQNLRESEAHLSAIMNTIPESLALLARDGTIIALNTAIAQRLNTTPGHAVGTCIFDYLPPEVAAVRKAHLNEVLATGTSMHFEDTHDGRIYVNSVYPVHAEQGPPVRVVVFALDVTQMRQHEREVQRSEARYRAVVEDQTELICRFTPAGRLTFVNQAYCHYFGKPVFQLLGSSIFDQIPEADHASVRAQMAAFTPHTPVNTHENIVANLRGESRWLQWTVRALFDPRGTVVEVQAVGQDVTERKQLEQALAFNNIILRTQQESSIDGILVVDKNDVIVSCNQRFVDLWGIPPDIMETKSDERALQSVMDKLARPEEYIRTVKQLYAARHEISRQEVALKDGRTFDRYSAPMFDAEGNYYGRVWYFRDITGRKQAETVLRESEALLAKAQHIAHIGSWQLDDATHELRWSDETFRMFGYVPGAVCPTIELFVQHIHPEDRAFMQEAITAAWASRAPFDADHRIILPDGHVRTVHEQAEIQYDVAGQPEKWVGTVQDITVRTQAEVDRQKITTMLNETGAMANVGGWEFDVMTGIPRWTDETYRIFDVDVTDKEPLLPESINFYAPASRPTIELVVQRAIAYGEAYDVELEIITKKGRRRWVHTTGKAHQENGLTVRLSGAIQDITARKQVENQERLARQILDLLNHWENEPDVIRAILQLVQTLTGFDAVAIRMQSGDDFPYYTTRGLADDFVQAENYLCARNPAGEIIRDEQGNPLLECLCGAVLRGQTNPAFPFFTAAGSFWCNGTTPFAASTTAADRPARMRGRCITAGFESVALIPLRAGNKIIGLLQLNDRQPGRFTLKLIHFFEGIGASIGIAFEHKQIERALAASEQQYRALYQNLPLATATWEMVDHDFVLLSINQTATNETHTSADHLLGQRASRLYAKQPAVLAIMRETAQGRRRQQRELDYTVLLTGRAHPASCTCGFVSPNLIIMHIEDISARRRAESKLRHYQRQLRALASQLTLAEERARRGIAADLHDQVCQTLAAIKLKLSLLTHTMVKGTAVADLQAATAMVDQCLHATRTLSFDLSPPVLYELGLEAALAWLADHLGKAGQTALRVVAHDPPVSLADDLRVLLFIVTREAIMNALKHARAREIVISIAATAEHLQIDVRDDGCGFAPEQTPTALRQRHGFGLFSIRERLRHVGGEMQITSTPGAGTTVAITLPLKHRA